MKILKNLSLALILTLSINACDSNSIPVVDADLDPTTLEVGFGLIFDGYMVVEIELGIFGTEEADLTGAEVDIYRNGSLYLTGINAADYYDAELAQVRFNISPVADGDTIGVNVLRADGVDLFYEGDVSDTEATVGPIGVLED